MIAYDQRAVSMRSLPRIKAAPGGPVHDPAPEMHQQPSRPLSSDSYLDWNLLTLRVC